MNQCPVRFHALALVVAACVAAAALLWSPGASAQTTGTNSPAQLFTQALTQLMAVIQPPTNLPPRTFTTTFKVLKADGAPKELEGVELEVAFQAPDHLRLSTQWEHQSYVAGRDKQELWVYAPAKKFGLIGSPDIPPFSTAPAPKDTKPLGRSSCQFKPNSLHSSHYW